MTFYIRAMRGIAAAFALSSTAAIAARSIEDQKPDLGLSAEKNRLIARVSQASAFLTKDLSDVETNALKSRVFAQFPNFRNFQNNFPNFPNFQNFYNPQQIPPRMQPNAMMPQQFPRFPNFPNFNNFSR